MVKFNKTKIICTSLLALAMLVFTSCVSVKSSWDGTLTQNGKALKITLKEGGSVVVNHFEVSINGEYAGKIEKLNSTSDKHTFSTLKTKFGLLRVERLFRYGFAGNNITFDCYLNDEFVGSFQADS